MRRRCWRGPRRGRIALELSDELIDATSQFVKVILVSLKLCQNFCTLPLVLDGSLLSQAFIYSVQCFAEFLDGMTLRFVLAFQLCYLELQSFLTLAFFFVGICLTLE